MMGVNVVGAQASNNNRPTPDVESSVQLEQTVDEFRNWKKEEAFKNILPKAHVSYNKKVTVVMVSDPVAWNVTNLRKPLDWSIPTDTVAPGAKVKAGIWINLFKSYVMKYMKEKVKSIFLKNFNSEKYRHLREDGNILMNYNEMCRVLTPLVSKSVRNCLCLCMIEKFLNLNSHYCCFFREPQAWEFKFKEHDNIYIELSDKFMNEHKVRYKTDGNPTNGCIQILAKYAITIVRRDICPSLRVRSKKKSYNKKGILQRRRNVNSTYNAEINVLQKDPVNVSGPCAEDISSDVNKVTPTKEQETVGNKIEKKTIIEEYKKEVKEYASTRNTTNPDGWLHISELEHVCFLLLYIVLLIRSNHRTISPYFCSCFL